MKKAIESIVPIYNKYVQKNLSNEEIAMFHKLDILLLYFHENGVEIEEDFRDRLINDVKINMVENDVKKSILVLYNFILNCSSIKGKVIENPIDFINSIKIN